MHSIQFVRLPSIIMEQWEQNREIIFFSLHDQLSKPNPTDNAWIYSTQESSFWQFPREKKAGASPLDLEIYNSDAAVPPHIMAREIPGQLAESGFAARGEPAPRLTRSWCVC